MNACCRHEFQKYIDQLKVAAAANMKQAPSKVKSDLFSSGALAQWQEVFNLEALLNGGTTQDANELGLFNREGLPELGVS